MSLQRSEIVRGYVNFYLLVRIVSVFRRFGKGSVTKRTQLGTSGKKSVPISQEASTSLEILVILIHYSKYVTKDCSVIKLIPTFLSTSTQLKTSERLSCPQRSSMYHYRRKRLQMMTSRNTELGDAWSLGARLSGQKSVRLNI